MPKRADLAKIARERLIDSQALLAAGRHDGAAYLCGYAVEIALKVKIVEELGWSGFPENSDEFKGKPKVQIHDLGALLKLSGWEARIKGQPELASVWSHVQTWSPESRYRPPAPEMQNLAPRMLESAEKLIKVLL